MKGVSEDRAYQLIRQQATAQRIAMGVVARSIVTAHRVFEEPAVESKRPSRESTSVLRLPARKSP
jgi:hypothetical protein